MTQTFEQALERIKHLKLSAKNKKHLTGMLYSFYWLSCHDITIGATFDEIIDLAVSDFEEINKRNIILNPNNNNTEV